MAGETKDLIEAIHANDLEKVREQLANGARPDAVYKLSPSELRDPKFNALDTQRLMAFETTPLHQAAVRNPKILEACLRVKELNLNIKDSDRLSLGEKVFDKECAVLLAKVGNEKIRKDLLDNFEADPEALAAIRNAILESEKEASAKTEASTAPRKQSAAAAAEEVSGSVLQKLNQEQQLEKGTHGI